MTGGNQLEPGNKNSGGKLSKAVNELREVEKVFPVVNPIIDGLFGAKEAAKAEMEESLKGVRSSARAAQEKAEEASRSVASVEERAERIEELAGRIAGDSETANQKASQAAESAASAEAAASSLKGAFDSITTTNESKHAVTGAEAIQLAVGRTENLPKLVVAGINAVFKGTVTDLGSGKPVEKKGTELLAHVVATVESATAAADSALKDADEAKDAASAAQGTASMAKSLVERAESSVAEARSLVGKAEAVAKEAKEAANEVKASLEELKTEIDLRIKLLFNVLAGELESDQEVKPGVTVGDLITATRSDDSAEEG